MRLFIGLRPGATARAMISAGFAHLRPMPDVSWVPMENLHLTLAFLGEVDGQALPRLQRAIDTVGNRLQPVTLAYSEVAGAFPNWRSPRVIWLGVNDADSELTRLHRRLWNELTPLGFQDENRFHPHITLGRLKRQLTAANLEHLQQARWSEQKEQVAEITLFESILRPQGPLYRVLSTHML